MEKGGKVSSPQKITFYTFQTYRQLFTRGYGRSSIQTKPTWTTYTFAHPKPVGNSVLKFHAGERPIFTFF